MNKQKTKFKLFISLTIIVLVSLASLMPKAQASITTDVGFPVPIAPDATPSSGFRSGTAADSSRAFGGLLVNTGNITNDGNGGGLILFDQQATAQGKLIYVSLINNGGSLYVYEGFNSGDGSGKKRLLTTDDAVGGGGSGDEIKDTNSNTYIRAEENPDEDILRFATNGTEWLAISPSGNFDFEAARLNVSNGDILVDNGKVLADMMGLNQEIDNSLSGTAKTIDWNSGNKQKITLDDNCTLTFTAPSSGTANLMLKIIQDGTGGHSITWPAGLNWSHRSAPSITSDPNAIDIVTCYYDGSDYFCIPSFDFGP